MNSKDDELLLLNPTGIQKYKDSNGDELDLETKGSYFCNTYNREQIDKFVAKKRFLVSCCIIFIISVLALSFISKLLINTRNIDEMLLESSLIRSSPFRSVTHPEPPTALWGSISKPYPTGAFFTNLVVRAGDGPVATHPYGVKTLEVGIQVSYGAARRLVSRSAITDPFVSDWQISATQAYVSRAIESYDNFSVTMTYKTAGTPQGKYKAILVKGSPFITVVYENATPVISSSLMRIMSVDAKIVKDSVGVQYIVTLGNFQKWLVYCSEPYALTWKDNTLTSPSPIKGFIRIAILPNQNADAAGTILLNYIQRYPTGGSVSFQYTTPSTATMNIQYTTIGTGSLLMYALPHQTPLLISPAIDSDENKKVQSALYPIYSIKGKLKPIVGDNWKIQYQLPQISWNYALGDRMTTSQLDEIAKNLMIDVKNVIPLAIDPYSFGKQIGRLARLALIADNLGIADSRQQALSILETSLIPWLQNMNQDTLLYDKSYGGLVSSSGIQDSNANFGSGWYNDHHFHYGYFIFAGAVIARFDAPFFETNRAAFDTFVRDVCNMDSSDLDFPIARHKDFFDGHSWASGLFQQSNGKSQESSSEAVNAYYSVFLYSLVNSNPELTRFSQTLLAMEIQAALTYWHMPNDDIYDSIFAATRMVGNLGGLDVTASTWFGNEVEFVHGINMMPLSPATAVLFDQSFVQMQFAILSPRLPSVSSLSQPQCNANNVCKMQGLTGLCCPTTDGTLLSCCDAFSSTSSVMQDEWKTYIYNDLAVVDRDTAWKLIASATGFGIGNSKSNSLMWAASRPSPLVGFNLSASTKPNSVTVKPACASNSACDAIGLIGNCCPAPNGVLLGCCPKV